MGEGTNSDPVDVGPLDWPKFVELARYHRVQGLVWNALSKSAGTEAAPATPILAADARNIAASNLQAAAECRGVFESFTRANVSVLFLKGLTLGALAYANPALKSAIDIDLLVHPTDLASSAALLRELGYRPLAPRATGDDRDLLGWHKAWKESVWVGRSRELRIDLHTRTADNPHLISEITVRSPSQQVTVAEGVRLPTLADEELFAYLTVHGASSAWFRLKWITDFAAFAGRRVSEIEHLHRRSRQLGAGRASGQALLLADTMFGTLRDLPKLREMLIGDPTTRRLHRSAMRLLLAGPGEPTERPFGTLPIHLMQFELMPGLAFKVSELASQVQRRLRRS